MARQILTAERPDSFIQPFQWTDSDGDPIDITGYTVAARIIVGDVTFNLSEGSGITTVDSTGSITISLTSAQVDDFEEHFGNYELWVISPSGTRTTLLEGAFYVSD